MADDIKHTKAVIIVGECDEETRSACKKASLSVHTFEEVLKAGKEHPADGQAPGPDDISTFCYTRSVCNPLHV